MKLKTHLLYTAIFLICGLNVSLGQGLCDRRGGGFTVTPKEGCLPLRVVITNTVPNPASEGIGYIVTYNGVATQGLAFSDLLPSSAATYSIPGVFTILQRVITNTGQTLYHCEKVIVKEGREVNLTYNSCGAGKIIVDLIQDIILEAYDQVEINWGDGSNIEYWNKGDNLSLEHIYASTVDSPTVKVRGLYKSGGCQAGNSKEVKVIFQQAQLDNIKVTAVEMKQNGNLSFSFNGIGGIKTQVKYSSDGGNTYVSGNSWSLNGPQTYNVQSLNIGTTYKLKLSSEDNCAGQVDSDVVTTMVLKGESSSGSISLSWNKYDETATGFQGYELYANGELLKSFNSIDDIEYIDTDVECGSFVAYHIVAKLTGVTSQSAPIGIRVETDKESAIENASVTVNQDQIVILAEVPGKSYTLNIERADNGSTAYKRIMTLNNENEYQDLDVKPDEKSYCYRFSFESCDVKYPNSDPICTILLKKDMSVFSWTPERPFFGDLENYTVSQTALSGVNTEIDRQQNLSFTPQFANSSELEYTFRVKATSQNGNLESFSNAILYRRGAGVFVPAAFTPNDDSHNNTLYAVAEQVKSFDFTIMNRWGNVVFHTSNLAEGWDGRINGTNAAVGSYVYKIVFVDDIDQKVEKRGTFMLLR
jgi:gliding motility-associated-like protein